MDNPQWGWTNKNDTVVSHTSRFANDPFAKVLRRSSKKCTLFECQSSICTKVLLGNTILTSPTGDRTAILGGHPSHASPRIIEGCRAICSAKVVPSFLSYFKTLSIGPTPGIEPATFRSAVKRFTDRANPVLYTKKCDTHVYTSFFLPQLGNWPNTSAKRLQKLAKRTSAKRP